ncbi:MAG: hypothetical protein LBU61_06190, partial [Coriobacteriales bacterium]|nr:hypothetical protein [Coriobacteriales bacterium]
MINTFEGESKQSKTQPETIEAQVATETTAATEAMLFTLMQKYSGVRYGYLVDQQDIALIKNYHQTLYPKTVGFWDNIKQLYRETGTYSSELEAVLAVVIDMRSMTDRYNLEVAVVITVVNAFQTTDGMTT